MKIATSSRPSPLKSPTATLFCKNEMCAQDLHAELEGIACDICKDAERFLESVAAKIAGEVAV